VSPSGEGRDAVVPEEITVKGKDGPGTFLFELVDTVLKAEDIMTRWGRASPVNRHRI
jgi:hypothetical protein